MVSAPQAVLSATSRRTIGDVNGDAHPDLAVANSSSSDVSVLLNGSFVGYW